MGILENAAGENVALSESFLKNRNYCNYYFSKEKKAPSLPSPRMARAPSGSRPLSLHQQLQLGRTEARGAMQSRLSQNELQKAAAPAAAASTEPIAFRPRSETDPKRPSSSANRIGTSSHVQNGAFRVLSDGAASLNTFEAATHYFVQ